MKERRKPEYPEKTPDDELQKMLHTKAQKFKPRAESETAMRTHLFFYTASVA